MVSIGRLYQILKKKIETEDFIPVLVYGDVGLGKSSVFWEVAEDLGLKYFSMNVGYKDGWELKGYPAVRRRVARYFPFTWQKKYSSDSVVVFDDISNVKNISVYDSVIELLDRRAFGGYSWDRVLVGFTANEVGQSSMAGLVPEPIEGRCEVYRIDRVVLDEWLNVMNKYHGLSWDVRVGKFLEGFPSYLYVRKDNVIMNPRRWTLLSLRLKRLGRYDEDVVRAFIMDEKIRSDFEMFIKSIGEMPSVEDWNKLSLGDKTLLINHMVSMLNAGKYYSLGKDLERLWGLDREWFMFLVSQLDDVGRKTLIKVISRDVLNEIAKVSKAIRVVM